MTENQTPVLLNVLLTLWQDAMRREGTLRMICEEKVPDWQWRYRDCWDDATTLEAVMERMGPMREVVKAAILGTLTDARLGEVAREMLETRGKL